MLWIECANEREIKAAPQGGAVKPYESGDERAGEISKWGGQLLPKFQTHGLLMVLMLAYQSFFS